jgi:YaiO family outer membrane protein
MTSRVSGAGLGTAFPSMTQHAVEERMPSTQPIAGRAGISADLRAHPVALRLSALLIAAGGVAGHALAAPPPMDALGFGIEYSDVRIGARQATWRSQLLQWERRTASGGFFAGLEQRQRDDAADQLLRAGGFRVWEHWTLSGEIEKGFGAEFAPRHAAEAHAGYRVRPDAVLRIGHRHAAYAGSSLRLWAASGLYYRGDAEWELGVRHGTAGAPRQRIAFGLARGQWGCGARVSCGVRLSAGRNVFGADEVGFDTGTGWIGGVHAEYRFWQGHRLRVEVGTGRADRFRQDTINLTYRHALGH